MKSRPQSSKKRLIWAVAFVVSGLFLAIFGEISWGGHSCPAEFPGQQPCMFLSDWVNLVMTIAGLALLVFGATILILDRKNSQPKSRTRVPNVIVAVILIVLATPLLLFSVNPVQQGCLLSENACIAIYVQEARFQFIAYFSVGAALLAVAMLFLVRGREIYHGIELERGASQV